MVFFKFGIVTTNIMQYLMKTRNICDEYIFLQREKKMLHHFTSYIMINQIYDTNNLS
jgi:hypothetical protein